MPQPSLRNLAIAAAALLAASVPAMAPAAAAETGSGAATNATYVEATSAVRSVKVGLNKSLVIDLPRDARDILVSNPVIADAVIRTPRRIYVTGVAVGQSNVIVFDRAGQQIVSLDLEVERDSSTLSRMLARLIPGSAIDVEIVSDNIVLSGTVHNAADARRAEDIANIFANGGAQAPPAGTSGGAAVQMMGSGNQPPVSSVVNMLTIEGEDQVQLKVTVAEVQRNIVKQLGIDWNASNLSVGGLVFGAATNLPFAVTGSGPNSFLGGTRVKDFLEHLPGSTATDPATYNRSSFGATLRALEQTGMIKTLAEPTLTAISGESASFLAGGEFPVPIGKDSSGAPTIQFKTFGVALAFTPVVLSEGRISLHVKTEVSELSSEGALTLLGTSIPSLKVRRAETTLELPSGGSMVLGGLLQDNVKQSLAAIPGLGKLPILGQLFRSRDFQRNETELVIIVTPYLVTPVPRSALATPDQGFQAASDAQAILLGNINRVYGGPGDKPASYAGQSYKGLFGFIFE